MIKEKNTFIAYFCPNCGYKVISSLNIFALSNNMLKIKCACKESELVIQTMSNGKIRVTVPCILCPSPHSYNLTTKNFFHRDYLAMTCSLTQIDIIFIGKKSKVDRGIGESEQKINDLFRLYSEYMEDTGFNFLNDTESSPNPADGFTVHKNDDMSKMREDDTQQVMTLENTNPEIYNDILHAVINIYRNKSVVCSCYSRDIPGEYAIDLMNDKIVFGCKNCGESKSIEAVTKSDLDYITNLLYIELE